MTDTVPIRARIIATPCVSGRALSTKHVRRVETSTDIPTDALGEVVSQALHSAWRAGHDPADPLFPFTIKISFETVK